MQQGTGFDFRSLAQAAGQGLPPMPKGVATLEDLERHARAPPGFGGHRNPPPKASQVFAAHSALSLPPGSLTQPKPVPWGTSDSLPADPAAAQDSGQALLSLLSNVTASAASAQQPGPTATTPPPGFPASAKPQTPINWGSSSQLQGIWGAPTPSSGSQATWGAPASAAGPNSAQAQLPKAYSLQSHTAEQAAPGTQPQGWPSSLTQTATGPPGVLPGQPNSAMQGPFSTAGQLDHQRRAGSVPTLEIDSIRGSMASNASNPLLALLGQHRSSMAQGMPCSSITLIEHEPVTDVCNCNCQRMPFHSRCCCKNMDVDVACRQRLLALGTCSHAIVQQHLWCISFPKRVLHYYDICHTCTCITRQQPCAVLPQVAEVSRTLSCKLSCKHSQERTHGTLLKQHQNHRCKTQCRLSAS